MEALAHCAEDVRILATKDVTIERLADGRKFYVPLGRRRNGVLRKVFDQGNTAVRIMYRQ